MAEPARIVTITADAEAACATRGGALATVRGPESLGQIVGACAGRLPEDLTPCWTGIRFDRERGERALVVAPFQPTMSAVEVTTTFASHEGFYTVCAVAE